MRLTVVPAFIFGVTLAFVLSAQSATHAQAGKTIWDGVYTDEQAARGRELYASTCATCHKEDLSGERGPNLAGDGFFNRFEADHLFRIYNSILTRMPADNRGTLRPDQAADLVAFLMNFNKVPSGAQPLAASADTLATIRVTRDKDGVAAEVANFSLVQVVGCLTQNGAAWVVANATAPMVTKNPEPSKDADLTQVQARPLGSDTFGLMLLSVQPSAIAPHKGSKVEAKGLLIRGPQNRLNLTSMQAIGTGC
jgi:mono/diheme cytochrome c family protein